MVNYDDVIGKLTKLREGDAPAPSMSEGEREARQAEARRTLRAQLNNAIIEANAKLAPHGLVLAVGLTSNLCDYVMAYLDGKEIEGTSLNVNMCEPEKAFMDVAGGHAQGDHIVPITGQDSFPPLLLRLATIAVELQK